MTIVGRQRGSIAVIEYRIKYFLKSVPTLDKLLVIDVVSTQIGVAIFSPIQ